MQCRDNSILNMVLLIHIFPRKAYPPQFSEFQCGSIITCHFFLFFTFPYHFRFHYVSIKTTRPLNYFVYRKIIHIPLCFY